MSNQKSINEAVNQWLSRQSFFHGFLPRDDLPFVLKKRGDYVIRSTERMVGTERRKDIVLSVSWPSENTSSSTNDIRNWIIERQHNSIYIEKPYRFLLLNSLLEFYKKHGIRIEQPKMIVRLLKPVALLPWEFRHSQIVLIKKVGQGAYGEVFKGKIKRGKKMHEVAVKMMKPDGPETNAVLREVLAEARLMRSLNHPNIVRCRGIAVLEQPLYIVIDFVSGGGLDSYLKKKANTLTEDIKNKMAISAAWGIEFMHSHDIIHRDIAARNCLYDAVNYVKLSDFGLSRKGESYKMAKARKLPTKWMAPESLQTCMFYKSSDVYTYGILLYEIYTCQEPYKGMNGAEARKKILQGIFPAFEKEAPKELYKIITKKVLLLDHTKRSEMKEIVQILEEWLQVELVIEQDELDKTAAAESQLEHESMTLRVDDSKDRKRNRDSNEKPEKPRKPEKQKPEKREKQESQEKHDFQEMPEVQEKQEKRERREKQEVQDKLDFQEMPEVQEKPEKQEAPEKPEKQETPEKPEQPEIQEKANTPEDGNKIKLEGDVESAKTPEYENEENEPAKKE